MNNSQSNQQQQPPESPNWNNDAWNRIWAIQQSSEFGADMHPLLICALYGQNYVYHQLAKNVVDKNPVGMMGMTPLFIACRKVVKLFMKFLIH